MSLTVVVLVVFLNLLPTIKMEETTNDTILEFFNNCKCVGFFSCKYINEYSIASDKGLLDSQGINCAEKYYKCCNLLENTENSTADTNTNTITTTTQKTVTDSSNTDLRGLQTKISCGVSRTSLTVRILTSETDSETTIPGEHPWMVEIFEKNRRKNSYSYICAGTLIHPRVVMTVLHYVRTVSEQDLKVVATGKETFQNLGENPENELNVFKTIKHPNYYSGGLYNDIALLILENDFEYSKHPINSICLPDVHQSFDGHRCLAVGWGANPEHASVPLKKVDLPVVNFRECQDLLRKPKGVNFNLHESFLCAGGEEGKDTCNGDGGSPLICIGDNYQYVQAGIVSWGVQCGVVNQPGVYTNVSHFKDWIVEELRAYDIKLG